MQAPSRSTASAGRRVALVVGVGLATGVITQIGQSVLPDGWSQVANAISPWLFIAFLVGATMPDARWAAAAGIATLVLALVGYYAMVELRFGYGASTGSLVRWGVGALVGGPVFGVAGWRWRVGPPRQRAIALGLLVAVAIAEGAYDAVVLGNTAVGAGFILAGLVVPLLLGRGRDDRLGAYLAALPWLALGALGYVAFTWFDGVAAGV